MKNLILFLFIIFCCFVANAQWNNDPAENNLISPVGAGTYDFEAEKSINGNVFVTYLQPKSGNIQSVLQIIDTDGNMLFPDGGLIVSNKKTISMTLFGGLLFVDNDGNAIIAVTDCRNSFEKQTSYTLYKVSSTGEMLWGEDGVELAPGMAFDFVACMSIVQIEDGSYICAWIVVDSYSNTAAIHMQRISNEGELLWSEKEIPQFNYADTQYPFLVNAGNNQVVLIFTRGSGRQLMARKIDFDGSSVWSEDLYIYRGGFSIPPLQVIIRVIPDQMGGAFVGWYDDRNFINQESTYVAHVTSNGKLGFASGEGGERVGYNEYLRSFTPSMYFDKENNELYVAFRETSSGQGWQQITGQKLSIPSGELLWEPEGKEIAALTEGQSFALYLLRSDGNGNVAVFFESNVWNAIDGYSKDINNVMLLNRDGEYIWKDEIIEFTDCVSNKGNMVVTQLINNNYWVAIWKDERRLEGETSTASKIYMQRINIDGTLGNNYNNLTLNIIDTEKFSVIPSVITESAEIFIKSAKKCTGEIVLYSITGQKIETIFSGHLHDGLNTIQWNVQRSKLSKGIYIVKLETDTERKALRIIIK